MENKWFGKICLEVKMDVNSKSLSTVFLFKKEYSTHSVVVGKMNMNWMVNNMYYMCVCVCLYLYGKIWCRQLTRQKCLHYYIYRQKIYIMMYLLKCLVSSEKWMKINEKHSTQKTPEKPFSLKWRFFYISCN